MPAIRFLIRLGCLLFTASQIMVAAAELPETVEMVPKTSGVFNTELETTIYRPEGPGPFPVVVINHGKAPGNPKFQVRYHPAGAARYFLARGYAVVVPMRQGFSKSSGSYIAGGCNVGGNGLQQAQDIVATLDYLSTQSWADKTRLLIAGQSHGGWSTLAFGTLGYPGVKGLIDFAGGLKQEQCVAWQQGLVEAAADYGGKTVVPSLWFYGDNDSYWPTDTWHAMFDRYTAAGAKARMVAFGAFESDSHRMFNAAAGAAIWQPEVSKFLEQIGLPYQVRPEFAHFQLRAATASASASGVAPASANPLPAPAR